MRSVRADRELELKQQLVGAVDERVIRAPVLRTHLAELARPVGDDERRAGVGERGVRRATGTIVPDAAEPAAAELIIARGVHPRGALQRVELIVPAPDPFPSADEPGA